MQGPQWWQWLTGWMLRGVRRTVMLLTGAWERVKRGQCQAASRRASRRGSQEPAQPYPGDCEDTARVVSWGMFPAPSGIC